MTAVKRPAPQMIFLYKSICALLALIFLCSAVVSGTMAWRDATQHKTNNVRGKYVPEEEPREGELTITKQVTVDSGQLTVDHLTREFEFIVNFYNIENGQSVIDTDCEYTYKIDGGTAQKIKSGGEIKLKHGQKAVITGLPKGKLYTVTETPAAGYTTTSVNNQGNAIVGNITAAFTNTFQTPKSGSLKITKQVTGDSGQLTVEQTEKKFNFTVDLILPADTVLPLTITVNGQPKQLSTVTCQLSTELRHDESVLISNLPAGTKYTVAEDDYSTDGYTATIDEYEGEIIGETELPLPFVNVHGGDGEDGGLTITKTVTGVSGDKNKLFNFTVDLILPADTVLPITITVNGQEKQLSTVTCQLSTELRHSESMVISNLPAGTEYTVAEDDYSGDDYATDVQNATGTIAGNETAAVSVTNHNDTPHERDVSITVTKEVKGEVPPGDKDKLFRFILKIDGVAVEFDLKAGQTGPRFPIQPGATYELFELDYTADGYIQSSVANGTGTAGLTDIVITKTNTYIGVVKTNVEGEKTWDFSSVDSGQLKVDSLMPEYITVNLKKGDTIIATHTVKPDTDGKWKYKFKDLPKYEEDDETEIVYTVEEVPIPDFVPTVDGYNIKNTWTKTGEKITLTGAKIWNHGGLDPQYHPKSITVLIYDGGKVVVQRAVTEKDHWQWAISLPKHRADGSEIAYTVGEIKIGGYDLTVRDGDLINTYNPDDPDGPDKPGYSPPYTSGDPDDGPKTNDDSHITLWVTLLFISMTGLFLCVFIGLRQNKKYKPKYMKRT